jgi:serine/threonine-protein kinase
MELVDGEDLSQRIARGAIPVDEALQIAKQIANALEAAHEQGIIHRDLKPANIKITLDGVVKVLDFGLAKLAQPAANQERADVTASPTITSPAMMTAVGVVLGTPAYMPPEQAKGRPADKRGDIWGFGCVLYEMLTGTRPFDGEDITDMMVAVLSKEPDWNALPASLPTSIRALLRRCLDKDRRTRIGDIAAARFALDEHASLDGSPPVLPRRQSAWRREALTVAALVLAGIAGTAVWFATGQAAPVPSRVSRLTIGPSGTAALTISGVERDLAISPDGSRVVYIGNRGTQLFVRSLDGLVPVAVFTGVPRGPFISPDGQWIGFVDNNSVLKKVPVAGGPAVTVATLDGVSTGATWTPDDAIIFSTSNSGTGLQRVGEKAGTTTVLTRPDRAQGESDHLWPELLPGGRAVLFTIAPVAGGLDAAQVAALDLQTGKRTILVRGGSNAHYIPSEAGPKAADRDDGYLVYSTGGTLRAVRFGPARLETRGAPVQVVADVMTFSIGGADAVVSSDGTLAYVSVSSVTGVAAPRTLVWVDRQGHETPIPAPSRAYMFPRLSPDGTRVAVHAADQELDGWIWDLRRTTLTRATFDPGIDAYPVWTPDGRDVIWSSERTGARNLFRQAADGTGAVERLTDSPNQENPTAVTPDGRRLIFTETAPKTGDDVMQLDLDEMHRVTPLVQSSFIERNGIVSPDGRWLAYEANDSGRFEIFVRPFPDVNSGHWQVSTIGGTRPLWARNGQELFYVSPTGAVLRVAVERRPSWATTTPTLLVKEGYFTNPGYSLGLQYDISSDGQRFVMIKDGTGDTVAPPQIIVVQHWTEELKRLVPTK